jgi:serine/threonine protein kinase
VEKIKFRELKIPADQWATHWTLLKQNLGLSPLLNSRWNPAWTDIKTDQLSDLWSLGISLLEITSGQHLGALHWLKAKHLKDPSDLKPNDLLMVDQEKVDQVLSALGQAPLVDLVEAQVVPIIRCLLRVNPEERCSAKEALQSLTPP